MNKESMTAFMSGFARAYHSVTYETKVFDDVYARALFSEEEWETAKRQVVSGIQFFEPGFEGDDVSALRRIMNYYIGPSPLGRAVYAEQMLKNAVDLGAGQYLIIGAGFDTFAYRQPKWAELLSIVEIDHPLSARDKARRVERSGLDVPNNLRCVSVDFSKEDWMRSLNGQSLIDRSQLTFISLLGIVYYLTKEEFLSLLRWIGSFFPEGSAVVFDYPDELYYTDRAEERVKRQLAMAKAAGEKMISGYSESVLIDLLQQAGIQLYEHLSPDDISNRFFKDYNEQYPDKKISAIGNVNYGLGVVKRK